MTYSTALHEKNRDCIIKPLHLGGRQDSDFPHMQQRKEWDWSYSFGPKGRKQTETGKDYLSLSNNKHTFIFSIAKCFATVCTNEYNPGLVSCYTIGMDHWSGRETGSTIQCRDYFVWFEIQASLYIGWKSTGRPNSGMRINFPKNNKIINIKTQLGSQLTVAR